MLVCVLSYPGVREQLWKGHQVHGINMFLVIKKHKGRMGANFGRCVAGLTASIVLSSYPILSWVDAFMHLHLSIDKRQRDKRVSMQI